MIVAIAVVVVTVAIAVVTRWPPTTTMTTKMPETTNSMTMIAPIAAMTTITMTNAILNVQIAFVIANMLKKPSLFFLSSLFKIRSLFSSETELIQISSELILFELISTKPSLFQKKRAYSIDFTTNVKK